MCCIGMFIKNTLCQLASTLVCMSEAKCVCGPVYISECVYVCGLVCVRACHEGKVLLQSSCVINAIGMCGVLKVGSAGPSATACTVQ